MSASQTRAAGPRLPSRAELNRATKATAAAIADPIGRAVRDLRQDRRSCGGGHPGARSQ